MTGIKDLISSPLLCDFFKRNKETPQGSSPAHNNNEYPRTPMIKALSHVYPVANEVTDGTRSSPQGSRESMRLQEFPGASDPAFAGGMIKNLTFLSNPARNVEPPLANIDSESPPKACKVRPDPCRLGSGRDSFKLPPILSSVPPASPQKGVKRVPFSVTG